MERSFCGAPVRGETGAPRPRRNPLLRQVGINSQQPARNKFQGTGEPEKEPRKYHVEHQY
jgi:hypothetical protein